VKPYRDRYALGRFGNHIPHLAFVRCIPVQEDIHTLLSEIVQNLVEIR
jgi:hypothetical protein